MDKSVTISRVGASVLLDERQDYGPDQLPVAAQLFAETAAGVRLSVGRPTIVGGMPRRGSSASWKRYNGPRLPREGPLLENHRVQRQDVEDIINSVLGRDPEQIRPFSLSWSPLIELLDHEGITVTEDQLIATPFVFELSDELLTELASEADHGH
ncbi:MAG: hypothetical protein M3Y09_16670 [Actinomycetota bacterium]|nr:hypothetical protein [Actinomycetota bacterium]